MAHPRCIPARASLRISTNPKEMDDIEVPLSPLTPPPRSVYRAFVTSVSESDADESPLIMSSPPLSKMTSPKPILHQRPLVSRSRSIQDPPSPPASGSSAGPMVHFGIPSILTPGSPLVQSPPTTALSRPPILGSRTVPLPQGVSSNSIVTTASAPALSTPKPTHNVSSSKSSRNLHPSTDLPSSPAKSLRQKAYERFQAPIPSSDKFGHEKKPSTGQRMKEGAFFALVILPMSCWYTRGGRKLGPGQKRLANGHMQMLDDEDTHSVDSRAPRMIAHEITPPQTPKKARRMSDDGYRRRNSLSSSNTPKRNMGDVGRRVSFDGKVTVLPFRRDDYERTGSITRAGMDRRDDYERAGSMSREKAMVLHRRGSFEEPRKRSNNSSHWGDFDGSQSAARDRERGYVRGKSFDSKALVHVARRDSFEYPRTGSMTHQQHHDSDYQRSKSMTRNQHNDSSDYQRSKSMTRHPYNDTSDYQRSKSMTRQQQQHNHDNYSHKVDHDRSGSFSQRGRQQEMQMQRYVPAKAAPMSRREWDWEREQDRRRDLASFGASGGGGKSRIISMGIPPPISAERWV